MGQDREKMLERVVKAIINWNEGEQKWDKHFLALQDHCDLIVEQDKDDENVIILKTKFK